MVHCRKRLALLTALFWAASMGVTRADSIDDAIEYTRDLRVDPPHISTDRSVKYDYDIVYVRAARAGDEVHKRFYTDIAAPVYLEPGADLMLLHPDGTEELLVLARKVAENREWAGLHHPSDTNGGRALAQRFQPYLRDAFATTYLAAQQEWI